MPEGSGKALWEKVYNASKKNGDSEEVAAKKAWAALKSAGWKKNEQGEWVKGKSEVQEFSMAVVKAVFDKENQVMRWRAVASDAEPDLYDERMSTELFNDFTSRIKSKAPVPEPFNSVICEESWCGGLPYLSVAHYKTGEGGKNVPGKIDEDGIYVDGTRLKAKGVLYDNPMGMATFKSLCDDLYSKKSDPNHTPVRISIGFLDLQHKHTADAGGQEFTFTRTDVGQICPLCAQGIGNKIYTQGQLVHLAMTRVPVNPRTAMEVDKSMDNGIITKKDDAKSIIGDLADELEEKSQVDDVLVIKADGSTNTPDDKKYDECYDPNTDSYDQECMDNLLMGNNVAMRKDMQAVKSEVAEKAVTKAEGDCSHPSSHYLVVEDASKPTTWHLRVKDCSGKVDTRLLGAAHAALTKGFRGNKYEGPSKSKALAKLRSLYKSHGLDWPEEGKSKSMVEDSMELGGKTVDEKKFEYEGVHGDPMQDMKKAPMKAKPKDEEETPEEDAKETKKDEEAEAKDGKKMKSLDAAYRAFKSRLGDDVSVEELNSAFQEFGKGVEKAFAPEPQPVDMANLSEVIKSAVESAVAPLRMEIAQLKAGTVSVAKSAVPSPRSIVLRPDDLLQKSAPNQPKRQLTQIERIARSSVGLNVE